VAKDKEGLIGGSVARRMASVSHCSKWRATARAFGCSRGLNRDPRGNREWRSPSPRSTAALLYVFYGAGTYSHSKTYRVIASYDMYTALGEKLES
jgi:hypothetical protein